MNEAERNRFRSPPDHDAVVAICTVNPIPNGVFWITHAREGGGQILPAPSVISEDVDWKFGMLLSNLRE